MFIKEDAYQQDAVPFDEAEEVVIVIVNGKVVDTDQVLGKASKYECAKVIFFFINCRSIKGTFLALKREVYWKTSRSNHNVPPLI